MVLGEPQQETGIGSGVIILTLHRSQFQVPGAQGSYTSVSLGFVQTSPLGSLPGQFTELKEILHELLSLSSGGHHKVGWIAGH